MLFKDWRLLDQSPVDLGFEKDNVYYVHSRAWALKGWLGGTHSWTVFWSTKHSQWMVIELTDLETISVQNGHVYWVRPKIGYQEHSPIISNRMPNAKWFGSTPVVVGQCKNTFTYDDFVEVCESYPIQDFRLVDRNCNTFTSFVISELNLNIQRPIRSIGFRTDWNLST